MIHLYTYSLLDGVMRSLILYLLMDFGISTYAVTANGSTFPMVLVCVIAVVISFLCSVFSLRNEQNKLLLKGYGLSASAFILFMGLLAWFFTEILPNFSFFPKADTLQGSAMYAAIISYIVTLALRIALLVLSVVRNLRANHRRLGG